MASLAPKAKKARVVAKTGDWRVIVMEPTTYKTLEVIAENISEEECNTLMAKLNALNDGKCYAFSVALRGIL